MSNADITWYSLTPDETLVRIQSSLDGLSEDEAERRLNKYGLNELQEVKRTSPLRMFLEEFTDPLVIILLFAILISVVTNLVGHHEGGESWVDAIVISAIVIFNAIFGFVQEYRSEKALEALKKMAAPKARVKRNGLWIDIDSRFVVPGDIIAFDSGMKIPADARILDAVALSVDESILTGESVTVRKTADTLHLENPVVGDLRNMVFQGSIVTTGKGIAVVIATGMNTEFGKIAQLVQSSEKELTPLQVDLEDLGKKVGLMILGLCAMVFFVEIIMIPSLNVLEALLVAIALAVAAIPEGLPAVVTITLAIGVQRMVRRNALVRRLPSVETLGSTTVICSDKTGTITTNEMTVRHIYTNNSFYYVGGAGYTRMGHYYMCSQNDPFNDNCTIDGEVQMDPLSDPHLVRLLETGQLCSNTLLQPDADGSNDWMIVGDPTEGALLVAAEKAGLSYEDTISKYTEVHEFSFDSKRKRMSTICKDHDDTYWAFVKGAPEVIIDICSLVYEDGRERPMTEQDRQRILRINMELASRAMRVLALAYKRLPDPSEEWDINEVENDLVFLGLVGMIDPPRPEVYEAIRKARTAGIRPIMITGDHELTARTIAAKVGLIEGEPMVVTGKQLETMTDEEISQHVREIDVFARVAPEHKLKIVRALKDHDHIVAMTGDGVNDAPAVKTADIGIAMGIRGADVTKEASDMILTDDNFASIVTAVEVGREIYGNIRKFVRYLLSANTGEVLFVFIIVMLGLQIPLIPVQILWLNLVTDGFPALALGVDPPEKGLMDRKGRKPGDRMLDRGMFKMIIVGGIFAFLSAAVVYLIGLQESIGFLPGLTGPEVDWSVNPYRDGLIYARTLAFASLILFELLFVFSCRDEHRPIWKTEPHKSKYLIIAVVFSFALTLLTIYTPLNIAFSTMPIHPFDWFFVLLVCLPALFVPYYKLFEKREKEPQE